MGYTFNGITKVISLTGGTTSFDVEDLYSRWKDWVLLSDNSKFPPAFGESVGNNALGGGVFLGKYFFLINGWVIRPQEANHILVVNGNLFPFPDSNPVFAATLGSYNVMIQLNTSSLTQALVTAGLPSSTEIKIDELHRIQGLDNAAPMTVTPTSRSAGSINLDITGNGVTSTTVTRT